MKGWVAAAVCAAGWAATCWEARRRWTDDGRALDAAREGLALGYQFSQVRSASGDNEGRGALRDRQVISRAAMLVGAALEARQR
jgi:hypothetical protein